MVSESHQHGASETVRVRAAGPSAATPQVAAAAALWLAEHWDTVQRYSQPWMRIEAVRSALFREVLKWTPKMNSDETKQKIGQGAWLDVAMINPRPLRN
jgi:hypothetical protein